MSSRCITFTVLGVPVPAGSKKSFQHRHTGKIVTIDTSGKRGKTWRQDVQSVAEEAYTNPPLTGPVRLWVIYYMPRPKGHFGTGRNEGKLKPSAPKYHLVRPDTLKLTRAIEDSLTHIIYRDDSQIVDEHIRKTFADDGPPRAEITVEEL